jgi:hypothetical protein
MKNNIENIEVLTSDPVYKLLVALYGQEEVEKALDETVDYLTKKKAEEKKQACKTNVATECESNAIKASAKDYQKESCYKGEPYIGVEETPKRSFAHINLVNPCTTTTHKVPKHITDYPGNNSSTTWNVFNEDKCVEKKFPLTDETICNFLTMMYSYNEFLNNTHLYGSENVFTMFKQAIANVLSEIFDSEKIATTLTNPVGEKTPDDIIKEIKKIYNK